MYFRFELEIATPGIIKPVSNDILIGSKPLSPPPAPPAVSVLLPEGIVYSFQIILFIFMYF